MSLDPQVREIMGAIRKALVAGYNQHGYGCNHDSTMVKACDFPLQAAGPVAYANVKPVGLQMVAPHAAHSGVGKPSGSLWDAPGKGTVST